MSETALSPDWAALVSQLEYDAAGLIAAVAQDVVTGNVLMVAWMNREAVAATLQTRKATFYSRSRQRQWVKGETSGHWLQVHSAHVDCDRDTLLLRVAPAGPACHTGRPTCFFVDLAPDAQEGPPPPPNFLAALEAEIRERQANASGNKSYTRSLLDGGADKIGGKLREEADELARAIAGEAPERVASEAADVLYHLLVGLRLRDVSLADVLEVLSARSGVSGLVEKAQRGTPKSG